MPYVPSDMFPVREVKPTQSLSFKVTGKWEDLDILAHQAKWLGKDAYNVVLVAGLKPEDAHELTITGDIYVPDDKIYRLVTQRIEEGMQVKMVYGKFYRSAYIYTYDANTPKAEEDDSLGDLENHPF